MLPSVALCWARRADAPPLRGRLDTGSSARHPIRLSDLRTTITAVLAVREAALLVSRLLCVQLHAGRFCCLFRHLHDLTGPSAGRSWIAVFDRHCGSGAGPHFMGLGGRLLCRATRCPGRVSPWDGCQHWVVWRGYAALAIAGDRRGSDGGQRHCDVLARHYAVGGRASRASGASGRSDRRSASRKSTSRPS